ncbi:MAG TPA: sugar transferase [Bryobacteraceae bacterium]|nr:sugar transferase [Bryobacteraceae bacterium]
MEQPTVALWRRSWNRDIYGIFTQAERPVGAQALVWQQEVRYRLASYPNARQGFRELTLTLRPLADQKPGGSAPALPGPPPLSNVVALVERLAAPLLLLSVLPLLFCAGLVVFALSRRSPLVAHERVGQGGKAFWVLKLRTMWGGEEKNGGSGLFVERLQTEYVKEIKRPDDPRITSRFAAACRKYSVDELPQLWHVVQGRMSLVGPRPMTAQEMADCYGTAAAEVLRFRPGLTGLWQIRGRSRLNYRQRRRLDLLLVRNWSVRLYLKVLIATIPRVLTAKDAW